MVPAFIGAAYRLAFVAARSTGAALALALTAAVHARPALGRQHPPPGTTLPPRPRRLRSILRRVPSCRRRRPAEGSGSLSTMATVRRRGPYAI
ncbi:hypothetical protein ACFWB2_13565 [Streptomyces virginiae]|uniref:hypothetical protein n=1 Tax=Streptomyces virginiae TaxID=1961 RepID=UPI003661CA69